MKLLRWVVEEFHGDLTKSLESSYPFQDAGNCKQSWRWHFFGTCFDCRQEILSCIVEAWKNITESLCVGRPQNDHLIQLVGVFEVSNVFSYLFHLFPFCPRNNIICTGSLRKGNWDVWLKYVLIGKDNKGTNFWRLVVILSIKVSKVMSVCYGAYYVSHPLHKIVLRIL